MNFRKIIPKSNVEFAPINTQEVEELSQLQGCNFFTHWDRSTIELFVRSIYDCVSVSVNGELSGYAIVSPRHGESHLLNLVIGNQYRGNGLGKGLMYHLLNNAKQDGSSLMLLDVHIDNSPALVLYNSLGFKQIGLRVSYYPDGKDALIMTKSLV